MRDLAEPGRTLVAPRKGLPAADESTSTIKKRFDGIGVENTEANRRAYREMLFRTPRIAQFISGVILYDETIRQKAADGTPLVKILRDQEILPGIKADIGAKPLAFSPTEVVTEGLDGLRERLAEYRGLGAAFTKWRAVIAIGDGIPSPYCIETNAHALARYDALNRYAATVGAHWELSFSYGRGLQATPQKTWSGKAENVPAAQRAFFHRAKLTASARVGQYSPEMERDTIAV